MKHSIVFFPVLIVVINYIIHISDNGTINRIIVIFYPLRIYTIYIPFRILSFCSLLFCFLWTASFCYLFIL